MVVNHLDGAERSGALELLVGTGGREDAGAVQARDLDGRLPHAAPGREHQHVLAALESRARHQHVPRGEKRQRERGGCHEVDVVGDRHEILHRHFHELGVPARMVEISERLVSRALVVFPGQTRRATAATHARLQHHAASGLDIRRR